MNGGFKMPTSKIQTAAKISYNLHANIFTDENKNRSVYDKIQKMVAIFDGANLRLSDSEKETLYIGAYLYYSQNPKSIEEGKSAPSLAEIQKLFGDNAAALITAFTYPHTPDEMTCDEQWEFKSQSFLTKKLGREIMPENTLTELLTLADTAADLMAERPADHVQNIAKRCGETLGKLILAHRLRDVNPHIADLIEKEGVRLLSAYVPLWQNKVQEAGIEGSVFAHLLRSSFAGVRPTDPWGRDKDRRVPVETYVEEADKNTFEYKLKTKDDYLGARTRVILQAAERAHMPVDLDFVSDLLSYTLTYFPEQGKAYNTAATAIGIALTDYIAEHADKDRLPDLLLEEMPVLEGLETLAQSVNSKTYVFESENLKRFNETPRDAQDCYDIKEAVLKVYNPFIVNHAHQKLDEKTKSPEKVNVSSNEYDGLLQIIMDRRRARGSYS